jgi:hypothetical protein
VILACRQRSFARAVKSCQNDFARTSIPARAFKGKFSLICPPDDLALSGGLGKGCRILAESLKVILMVRALYASTRTKVATRGHPGIRCHHGRRSSGAWSATLPCAAFI